MMGAHMYPRKSNTWRSTVATCKTQNGKSFVRIIVNYETKKPYKNYCINLNSFVRRILTEDPPFTLLYGQKKNLTINSLEAM